MPVTFRTFENIFTAPEVKAAIAGVEYVFNGSHGNESGYPINSFESGYINDANTAVSCSVIGGGSGNQLSGAYSAILGGHNNNDGGLAGAMIVGNGISAAGPALPNTLYINGLWANAIPNCAFGGTAATFQVYWDSLANLNASCCILLIK